MATSFYIGMTDLFQLKIRVNSDAMADIYGILFGSLSLAGGYLRFGPPQVSALPIPHATAAEKAEIAALVQQCLDKRGQNVAELEAEINARVASLYGL